MSLPKICTCRTVPAADCPFHHQQTCGSLAAMPCSPLVRDALERCIRMDEDFANSYRYDAARCAKSPDPEIKKRGPNLIARAEKLEKTAKAYRAILPENDQDHTPAE